MVLFEKNCLLFTIKHMMCSFLITLHFFAINRMSTCSNDCNVCGKNFKRLESHLSQNLACKSYYMSRCVNAAATVAPNIPNDSNHVNTSHVLQGASQSCLNLRSPSMYESHWILQLCNESSTRLHNADNNINWDGPDDKMQMIQEIMQIWRKLTKTFANVTMLWCSNLD
jgi:hypothetical protein